MSQQLYTWVRVCVLKDNSIQFIYGAPTDNKDSEPSQDIVNTLYNTRYGSLINAGTTDILRIPEIPIDAFEIHRVCVYGTQGVVAGSHTDYRSNYSNIQGLALTWTTNSTGETVFSITAGSFTAPNLTRGRISIGSEGEKFYKRKDAFTEVVELQVPKGRYKVTIKRSDTSYSNEDLLTNGDPVPQPAPGNNPQESEFKRYNKGYLFSITGYNTTVNPISPPPLCTIAKTALSITSNKSLNGTLEGINGLITSICRDYNPSTQTWNQLLPTNNPASLFLHVLTHPANAYRVQPGVGEQESDYINFTVLTEWWTFCSEQGFVYNNVITDITSVLDLLKDICAAGRASPTILDGKWSVVIDRARTVVSQYFTPYNSWGFESVKALPRQPHAFRVNFRNEEKSYQDDSILVPNIGYNEGNAQVIEEISIPGVTIANLAARHARWHLAQLKLRPERYTLNTDIEYIVCNRGDLVKVQHDVPAWGLGSGRIRSLYSENSTNLISGILAASVNQEPHATIFKELFNGRMLGDVNGNGTITSGDPLDINRYFSNSPTIAAPTKLYIERSLRYILASDPEKYAAYLDISPNSSNIIYLEDPVYLDSTKQYTILIRKQDGTSATSSIIVPQTSGNYNYVILSFGHTVTGLNEQDLYMFGELNKESQELIVLSIQPQDNYTAQLTLIDYSSEIYTLNFNIDYPEIVYNTNYTKPPKNLITAISAKPVINENEILSDETVLTRTSSGSLISNIRIPFTNKLDGIDSKLRTGINFIELEYDFAEASGIPQFRKVEAIVTGSITIENVSDGESYKFRARYLTDQGLFGPWTDYVSHQVVGKTSAPSSVPSITAQIISETGRIVLTWPEVADLDVKEYEIRNTDSGWGIDTNYLFKGFGNTATVNPQTAGLVNTYYIRARDILGTYSNQSTSTTLTISAPNPVQEQSLQLSYAQSSKTSSLATLTWQAPNLSQNGLPIKEYEIIANYQLVTNALKTITLKTINTSVQFPAEWVSSLSLEILTVDTNNNKSISTAKSFQKALPAQVSGIITIVTGTGIEIDWPESEISTTQLPIAGYELRSTNENFGFNNEQLLWRGTATKVFVDLFGKTAGQTYTAYLKAFDVEGNYSQNAATIQFIILAPEPVQAVQTPVFQDTSLTSATFTLNWTESRPQFGLNSYRVQYSYVNKTNQQVQTVDLQTKSTSITLPANWLGIVNVSITVIDNLNNESLPITIAVNIEKPNPISSSAYRVQIIDNNVLLKWDLPTLSTLPISHIRLKRSTVDINTWEQATLIGDKDGTFTVVTEQVPGTYRYWIVSVDTEANESNPIFITVDVKEPPNYVFIAEKQSLLSPFALDLNYNETLTINAPSTSFTDIIKPYISTPSTVTGMSTTAQVTSQTKIGVFQGGINTSIPRNITTAQRVNLSNVSNLYYYVNKGGSGWGEVPETGENLLVQYSTDNGAIWTTIDTTLSDSVSSNIWTLKTIQVPEAAKGIEGVLLRIAQSSFTETAASIFDTWAFTSVSINEIPTIRFINTIIDSSSLVLPINTTETWDSHFSARGWSSPQAQITAGYPIFIQPGSSTGTFREIFDFGSTILSGVQISSSIFGGIISGNPIINYIVAISADNTNWTVLGQNTPYVIAPSNFRYVRLEINTTQTNPGDLYRITKLSIKLDTTKINNSGYATTNASGITDINFSKDFFDISSVTVSASSTTPVITVYNFKDAVRSGTFTVSGTTCTVTTSTAHDLKSGYKVRAVFTGTGTVPKAQTYIVTVTSTTQFTFTVDVLSSGSSGTIEFYPNSMEIRTFNTDGSTAANIPVSWYVEGF